MSDKPQVVIVRKDKRLHKGLHLFVFMLTGGASAPISADKAASNALYNAHTRELQETQYGLPRVACPEVLATRKQENQVAWAARKAVLADGGRNVKHMRRRGAARREFRNA